MSKKGRQSDKDRMKYNIFAIFIILMPIMCLGYVGSGFENRTVDYSYTSSFKDFGEPDVVYGLYGYSHTHIHEIDDIGVLVTEQYLAPRYTIISLINNTMIFDYDSTQNPNKIGYYDIITHINLTESMTDITINFNYNNMTNTPDDCYVSIGYMRPTISVIPFVSVSKDSFVNYNSTLKYTIDISLSDYLIISNNNFYEDSIAIRLEVIPDGNPYTVIPDNNNLVSLSINTSISTETSNYKSFSNIFLPAIGFLYIVLGIFMLPNVDINNYVPKIKRR